LEGFVIVLISSPVSTFKLKVSSCFETLNPVPDFCKAPGLTFYSPCPSLNPEQNRKFKSSGFPGGRGGEGERKEREMKGKR